jgi:hypothetical protein
VGKELGKMGEQFGKRMGDWGVEFGKRANAWGLDVGKMASGSGTQSRGAAECAYDQTHEDLPPAYTAPVGQETGIPASTTEKSKGKDMDDYDDDATSISSDSLDSDSDSESDDEEYPDTEAMFNAHLRSINEKVDESAKKGKKSAEEVARDRALAIAKAQNEKEAMELKIASRLSKRYAKRELKKRGRELKRQHRQRKRDLRASHGQKGKAKKSREWREAKKEYREKKKELRKEKLAAKKNWREVRNDHSRIKREGGFGEPSQDDEMDRMVWLVIEDVAP